jgi:hypothetical protein
MEEGWEATCRTGGENVYNGWLYHLRDNRAPTSWEDFKKSYGMYKGYTWFILVSRATGQLENFVIMGSGALPNTNGKTYLKETLKPAFQVVRTGTGREHYHLLLSEDALHPGNYEKRTMYNELEVVCSRLNNPTTTTSRNLLFTAIAHLLAGSKKPLKPIAIFPLRVDGQPNSTNKLLHYYTQGKLASTYFRPSEISKITFWLDGEPKPMGLLDVSRYQAAEH